MHPRLRRRLFQSLGGVFPCNSWRARIGLQVDKHCPLCGLVEHFSHIVLWCPAGKDAVQLAHDSVWELMLRVLKDTLSREWEHWLAVPIHLTDIDGCPLSHLQPDGPGVLWNLTTQTIHLLEFSTSDFYINNFQRDFLAEQDCYVPLVTQISDRLPHWSVTLSVFILGDRGLYPEHHWQSLWQLEAQS